MQFRTKARAVDLLGKGQIADLPTAITELWKNGYDAYADNLTAEIFLQGYKNLQNPIFIITDDGTGMSKDDIFDKWLVLGVDTKSRTQKIDVEGENTLWKKPRIKAGEKGIGRLSVAYLGSPMLMVTRKQGFPMQAMFFDWRLLENYNMYLNDVQIPVEEITKVDFREKFEILKSDFLKNFSSNNENCDELVWKDQPILKEKIQNSINNTKLPTFFEQEIIGNLFDDNSHGTVFVIFEPEEQIVKLVKDNDKEDDVNDSEFVRTSLAGFTNPFKPKEERIPVEWKFLIHEDSDEMVARDFLKSQGAFFEEDDYNLADIVIDGRFDGKGSFGGNIRIYNQTIDYSYTNPRKEDIRSFYGEFPIKVGYSMGNPEESFLKEENYNVIRRKVDDYGGLYIYRDGFRVLPYGRANMDFLGFEERRGKSFRAFFNYRRMFGYIGLSRETNHLLKDKSSREGLINNSAYRAFQSDLISFFVGLANEYFSSDAKERSLFLDAKEKLKKQNEIIKKDKEREKVEKRAFSQSLREYPQKFNEYKSEYENTISELERKLNQAHILFSDIENLLSKINELNVKFESLLPQLPKRFKLTEDQENKLFDFEKQLKDFKQTIEERATNAVNHAKSKLQIQDLKKDFINTCNQYSSELESLIDRNISAFIERYNLLLCDIKEQCNKIKNEFQNQKMACVDSINYKEDIGHNDQIIRDLYDKLLIQLKETVIPFVEHFQKLSFDIDEDMLQGAYKEQYDEIKRQWELVKDTSQLGIAVEIIDHEFNVLYSRINDSLNVMNKDAHFNNSKQFNYLDKSFHALEDKYALLSPLYRINGSVSKDINCVDLKSFIGNFFENKIANDNVKIKSTSSFDNHVIFIKEPVIYTVLINIVNNALYWIKNSKEKTIEFEYNPAKEEIIIRNSGEPIRDNKLEKIFELFYSNRPNGRGIGLFLSKQSLNNNYFDLYATNDESYNTLGGACFVITKQLKK